MSSRRRAGTDRPARMGRRSLLAGVAGGIGYFAGAAADPLAAHAANGDPVILGRVNRASATTVIRSLRRGLTTLRVRAVGRTGVAVEARSPNVAIFADGGENGTGLHAVSVFGDGGTGRSLFGAGLQGLSGRGRGVVGESEESHGVAGTSRFGSAVLGANFSEDQAAVVGWAQNRSTGVQGIAAEADSRPPSPRNTGVHGIGNAPGATGVFAESAAGTALRVNGSAVFSRSGVLMVDVGAESAVQTGIALSERALVLAVLRDHHRGVHVEAAVPDPREESFTVYLNRRVTGPAGVVWFVIN